MTTLFRDGFVRIDDILDHKYITIAVYWNHDDEDDYVEFVTDNMWDLRDLILTYIKEDNECDVKDIQFEFIYNRDDYLESLGEDYEYDGSVIDKIRTEMKEDTFTFEFDYNRINHHGISVGDLKELLKNVDDDTPVYDSENQIILNVNVVGNEFGETRIKIE